MFSRLPAFSPGTGGGVLVPVHFYACFLHRGFVFDRYSGRKRIWMVLVCMWLVDVTGVCGRVLIQVVFMASVPFLSAGHGWIWFPSVPVVGFGYEKTPVLGRCWDCGGLVGVQGEEGVSWTSSIVTHFSVNACKVIDQFVTNLLNFQPLCLRSGVFWPF